VGCSEDVALTTVSHGEGKLSGLGRDGKWQVLKERVLANNGEL
jgi:hypothetical protein